MSEERISRNITSCLGQQYKELSDEQDEIAERIRMMGEASPASFTEFLELSDIKEEAGGFIEYRDMISNLLADHNQIIKVCHEGLSSLEGVVTREQKIL